MPRYADFQYGTGEQYGPAPKAISASFLTASALDYDKVRVYVEAGARTGSGYVLVRTRSGAAEDPSSGVIVSAGTVPTSEFYVLDGQTDTVDDEEIPLPSGIIYYTFFVFDTNGRWLKDAATSVLVPQPNGSWERVVGWIPRVYTSSDQNPLSDPDFDGPLARFLYGISLTYDEIATSLRTLLPDQTRRNSIRRLHDALAEGKGMPSEYSVGVRATSRLYRDAGYLYTKKGTLTGVAAYIEDLTGWDTSVSSSPNRILSLDDASFESTDGSGVGHWSATGGTIARLAANGSSVTTPAPPYEDPVQTYGHDAVALITLTGSSATATLPGNQSRELSIPVTPGTSYTFSAYLRLASGTPSASLRIDWLDSTGVQVSTTSSTATALTSTWNRRSKSATAPTTAQFARLKVIITGASGHTAHLDMVQFSDQDVSYQDPRLVTVVCSPTRINLLGDPGFDLTTVWSATSGTLTRSTQQVHLGTYAAKADGSSFAISSEEIPVRGNYSYSVSGYASLLSSPGTAAVRIDWYDAAGTVIQQDTTSFGTLTNGSWSRLDKTAFSPAAADHARVVLTGTGTVYFDSFVFERTDRPQVFFDANTTNYTDEDGKLALVGSKRYHLLYSNRLVKLSRAIRTLPYYLPLGVSGRILLWDSLDPAVQAELPYGPVEV